MITNQQLRDALRRATDASNAAMVAAAEYNLLLANARLERGTDPGTSLDITAPEK